MKDVNFHIRWGKSTGLSVHWVDSSHLLTYRENSNYFLIGLVQFGNVKPLPEDIQIQHALKNAVFWDVSPCSSCVNRSFGGSYRLHLQGGQNRGWGISASRWLQTTLTGFSQVVFSTLKMEGKSSSETSGHTGTTRQHIPEKAFFIVTTMENLKSYIDMNSL
jgi:hypothetical protein